LVPGTFLNAEIALRERVCRLRSLGSKASQFTRRKDRRGNLTGPIPPGGYLNVFSRSCMSPSIRSRIASHSLENTPVAVQRLIFWTYVTIGRGSFF